MVNPGRPDSWRQHRSRRGTALLELVLTAGILMTGLLPLTIAYYQEQQFFRFYYQRAVAMELVDGEMEILAAGAWRSFGEGSHEYRVESIAAANLPPGKFRLTVRGKHILFEWIPESRRHISRIAREVHLP